MEDSPNIINQAGNKEALELWRSVTLNNVRVNDFNLSERQMSILLTVYTRDGKHTVKNLAEELNITKPPVCRALDSLSKLKLIAREIDKEDRRNVFIVPTSEGYDFLGLLSNNIMDSLAVL